MQMRPPCEWTSFFQIFLHLNPASLLRLHPFAFVMFLLKEVELSWDNREIFPPLTRQFKGLLTYGSVLAKCPYVGEIPSFSLKN
jgi:hypothetical protein